MKKGFLLFLLPVFFVPAPGAAGKEYAEVVYIQDNQVYFDMGARDGVKQGDIFQVTRPGKDILHPRTGKKIGQAEKLLCRVVVILVRDEISAGKRPGEKTLPDVRVGDRVSPVHENDPAPSKSKSPGLDKQKSSSFRDGPSSSLIRKEEHQRTEVALELDHFETVDMAAADLDGDGASEIIVTNGDQIRVYRLDTARKNFVLVSTTRMGFRQNIVDLSAGDVDGDGRAEVCAVSYPGRYVKSFLYKFQEDSLRPVNDFYNRFLKILKEKKGVSHLLSQDFSGVQIFSGAVHELIRTGEKWDEKIGKKWKRVNIFGLGYYADDRSNRSDFFYINHDGILERYRGNDKIWQDASAYGGSRILFSSKRTERELQKNDGLLSYEIDGISRLFVIENRKSRKKLLNLFSLNLGNPYRNGLVRSLRWEKGVLTQAWSTRTLEGYLPGMDIFYREKDGDANLVLPAVVGSGKKAHTMFHFIPIPHETTSSR